jgi:hypothetical protein
MYPLAKTPKEINIDYATFGYLIEAYFIWKHEGNIIHEFSVHERKLVADERSKK